ncbi:MAG: transcriptional regulator [Hyphomonas sp. BRH_c22]|uniref:AbrB/MazE/SpoVT family DNA-binding domain-containing protein n=1 Tax=Hyphomonas sp. BRH_c22 TaxID=1629710 RepID=UPI0005F1EBE9|nr:AbrB/MazE/SpoVT family DNA-binding domain-containing protein [Hyphomonas sp. BRH_c22]KJS35822.1 MAG: transcriptional regulator [Hyphomonas sp. BRH_c22]
MTSLKVRKIGNSLGVVLPKEVLEALKVQEGDFLDVTRTKAGVELTVSDEEVDRLMQLAEKIMEDNREVLRALAK